MSDVHGGLSCEAAEEDRYGLAYGYAELPGLRDTIAMLVKAMEQISDRETLAYRAYHVKWGEESPSAGDIARAAIEAVGRMSHDPV